MMVSANVSLFGWPKCVVFVNGQTRCVVTTDVGPRIVWLGHADDTPTLENNIFGGFPAQMGKSGEADFQFRMGHRFWLAPEEAGPKTYDPDNHPVEDAVMDGLDFRIVQKPGFAGLQKSIRIRGYDHDQGGVWISHNLQNVGGDKVDGVALWGLSGMAPNGIAIIPQPAFQYHPAFAKAGAPPEQIGGFLSAQNVVRWPYTNLQDMRLMMSRKFMLLRQDPNVATCNVNKFGLSDVHWVAYLVKTGAGTRLFIKRLYFEKDKQHLHPDRGPVFETFVCGSFLELEETGQMEDLPPTRSATPLVVRWSVHKIDRMPITLTDGWIDDNVVPLVGFTRES